MADQKNNDNPNDMLVDERRQFIRLNINVQINYSVIHESSIYSATSQDIGAGGIRLLVDQPINKGDVLKLEFLLPEDPPPIQAKGKVAWVKPFSIANNKNTSYDLGIEFVDISQEDRQKINKYVFSLKLYNK